MKKVTELELQILANILNSDHSSDGFGLCGYIQHDEYDMSKLRGALSSLVKKGIIGIDHNTFYKDATWCYVMPSFQKENPKSELNWSYTNIAV